MVMDSTLLLMESWPSSGPTKWIVLVCIRVILVRVMTRFLTIRGLAFQLLLLPAIMSVINLRALLILVLQRTRHIIRVLVDVAH